MDGRMTDYDNYLFHEGTNYALYRKLGAHLCQKGGMEGVFFALWAPHARQVRLLSDHTGWDEGIPMQKGAGGIWEVFVPGMQKGDAYRYAVTGADGVLRKKADPMAFYARQSPDNASVVYPLEGFAWQDGEYMASISAKEAPARPMAIYEVYLGSWKKYGEGFLNYRDYALQLADYVTYMGYTHVELMGICEFPFEGSWGYQVTGYFAPTSRYGEPDELRFLVDLLHRRGIGVILDWVPAHFPKDAFGLEKFDGTCLYESPDPLRAEYPEWGTLAFDHAKCEVRSFLISSACYWLREFHMDALRVDAVAAMLYASFGRGQFRPNKYGGAENLESTDFLRQVNHAVLTETHGFLIAEDSSIKQNITRPVDQGGIGFLFKWNMGWMNETLRYIEKDPVYRKWEHGLITHPADYAFTEQYVLPLSHDEVVHLKHSMLEKNPGNDMDKFGGLKAVYALQMTFPGKKLLFMGQDFAMRREWDEKREIDWFLCDIPGHRDVMECLKRLLFIYKKYPVLYTDSGNPTTFEWVNRSDADRGILAYIRRNPWNYNSALLVLCCFTPVGWGDYACGVPLPGYYKRIFSTYDSLPGELSDVPPVTAKAGECDGYPCRLEYALRPFEAAVFEFPLPEGADK